MARRYEIGGWVESVIEIRHAATPEEFFAFVAALAANPMCSPYLHQLAASGGPAVGALMLDQHESTSFYRLACPAMIVRHVLDELSSLLGEHMPDTPKGL